LRVELVRVPGHELHQLQTSRHNWRHLEVENHAGHIPQRHDVRGSERLTFLGFSFLVKEIDSDDRDPLTDEGEHSSTVNLSDLEI